MAAQKNLIFTEFVTLKNLKFRFKMNVRKLSQKDVEFFKETVQDMVVKSSEPYLHELFQQLEHEADSDSLL